MSFFHSLSVNRVKITKKSVARIAFVLISGLVIVAVIRSSSSNVEFNDGQITSKWEQLFQTATNTVVDKLMSDPKRHQPNVNCQSTTDWDALLDSETLTGPQLIEYFMWTNHSSCQLSHDFGGLMMDNPSGLAGQKAVCIDPEVAPKPGQCLVYSFGINGDWSFDEKMSRYGCDVYAFDPSMDMGPHDHSPGNVHFYNWALGDRNEYDNHFNWTIYSLSTIYKKLSALHGPKIIDYLKIDIEYSEWIALPQMIASGMLANVRQLGMEVHLNKADTLEQHVLWAKLLRTIEKMGMVRFDSEYNPWFMGNFTLFPLSASLGYEIAWYNSNLTRHLS
jgi:hypothetical protein